MPKPKSDHKWEPPEALQSQLVRLAQRPATYRPFLLLVILSEWAADWVYCGFDRVSLVRMTIQAGVGLSVIAGITTFIFDYSDRQQELRDREQERIIGAWKVLHDTREEGGNFGQKDAVEFLHRKGRFLNGVNLKGAIFIEAKLNGARLSNAVLENTNFVSADLSRSDLTGANLISAILVGTNLSGAWLVGARLNAANLRGANLSGVDLSGLDLSEVKSLIQPQLDSACGNTYTKLPNGLHIEDCFAKLRRKSGLFPQ